MNPITNPIQAEIGFLIFFVYRYFFSLFFHLILRGVLFLNVLVENPQYARLAGTLNMMMVNKKMITYTNVSVLVDRIVSLVKKVLFVLLFVIQASFAQEAVPSWKHDLFYSVDLCVIGSVKDVTGKKEENPGLDIKLEELIFSSMEPLSIGKLVRISDDRPVLGTKDIKVTEFKYRIKTADGWQNIRRFEKPSGENQILLIRVDLSEKMDSLKLILINVIPLEDIAIVRKTLQQRVALESKLHRSLGLDLKFKKDEKNDRKVPE